MALHCYFLLTQCVILYINADVAFNETSAQWIPNHNMRDNIDDSHGVYDLITTFFDLLWYIVGLIVLCVCSISCVLLFYIHQRRRHDPKPQRPISESTRNTTTTATSSATIVRNTSSMTPSPVISVTSITKSPSKSPQLQPSLPTATHSKNNTYSNYSLSAFSGVDSEGVDLDDNNAFSEYNHSVFKSLAPISEHMNCSPSISSRNRFKRNFDDDETLDDDTDDMESVQLTDNERNDNREDSVDTTESSESAHPMTIIAMMKKRAQKQKSPVPQDRNREQRNSAKYKRRYAQTIQSSTELEHDFV